MQDVAIEHSATVGWPMRRYLELGAAWVVRSHFIEYFRPAFAEVPFAGAVGVVAALFTALALIRAMKPADAAPAP
jgi:hypothetical protein